jgi:hypothetical protein
VQVDRRGTVGVTYYDFTADDPAGGPLSTDYWFTSSANGGLTFAPRDRVTAASFDMRAAPDANGFFLGDYQGLATSATALPSIFAQANAGQAANRTDLFATTLAPSGTVAVAAGKARGAPGRAARTRLEGPIKLR